MREREEREGVGGRERERERKGGGRLGTVERVQTEKRGSRVGQGVQTYNDHGAVGRDCRPELEHGGNNDFEAEKERGARGGG